MKLTRTMSVDPTASQMGMFQAFVARAMEIQGRLSRRYHGDRYLRDRLQEAISIPSVHGFLKDRPPNSAQELVNRVGNKLFRRPKTARAVFGNWSTSHNNEKESMALYSLGKNYGGSAVRPTKSFVKNMSQTGGRKNRNHRRYAGPRWMCGINGFFVCKKDHRGNQHHS